VAYQAAFALTTNVTTDTYASSYPFMPTLKQANLLSIVHKHPSQYVVTLHVMQPFPFPYPSPISLLPHQ
jgi:hypothetical protein